MKLWFIIIPVISIVSLFITVFIYSRNKRNIDYYIRSSFGSRLRVNSDISGRVEVVVKLFDVDRCAYNQDELIDSVTWDDLDMDSIFQQINHTDSYAGEQVLYSKLHILNDTYSNSSFNDESISYFQTHADERTKVRKILYSIGKSYNHYCTLDNVDNINHLHMPFRYAYPLLVLSMLTFGVVGLILWNPYIIMLFVANYLLNLILHMALRGKFATNMNAMSCVRSTICAGDSISHIVPNLSEDINIAIQPLQKVVKLLNIIDLVNIINKSDDMSLLFSYIGDPFMLDFIAYDASVTLLSHRQKEYMLVYRYVGEIDSSIAIASYRESLDDYCVPAISDDNTIKFADLYHPLLNSPVPNSIILRRNAIFTGSNASGKSTFIKAIAINLILGQAIYTCTADYAVIPKCNVLTSMAVRDDLSSSESYYIKEIKYLKRMVDIAKSEKLSFFAIDEILKGTNTKERIAASKAVLKYFDTANCILAVATHDVELADYFSDKYSNYFFCESCEDSEVVFEYRLHKGICRTSNAIKLLGVMDYPTDIVDAANDYMIQPL